MFWGQSGHVLEIRNHYWGRAGRDGVCGGDLIKTCHAKCQDLGGWDLGKIREMKYVKPKTSSGFYASYRKVAGAWP